MGLPWWSSGSVQSLSLVHLFVTLWTVECQTPLSITTPGACSNSCSMSRWCSFSVVPFSFCLQSFPASGSFPMSQFFAWGGQVQSASQLLSSLSTTKESMLCNKRSHMMQGRLHVLQLRPEIANKWKRQAMKPSYIFSPKHDTHYIPNKSIWAHVDAWQIIQEKIKEIGFLDSWTL